MRARRLLAVALAFVLALAVFSATRGDERAAAGPPIAGLDTHSDAAKSGKLVDAAALAARRHDFHGALRLARRACALAPGSVDALPVMVDALVELGRYERAERVLQRLVDRRPGLAAYARVSYLRELHGDLDGAAGAMDRAIGAGGSTPADAASARALLGDVEAVRGRPRAARRSYTVALVVDPGHPSAVAGLAHLAAGRGDLREAIARWRGLAARAPLPEHLLTLGEAELAAGRLSAARRHFALMRARQRELAAAGADTDVEMAVFEADHGDPRRGLVLARRAWATAPSVRSADALGWALTRSGRPVAGLRWAGRALRLGSLDPLFRFHAGMSALAAGHPAQGRRELRTALAHGLAADPWQAAWARRSLARRMGASG